MGFSPSSTTYSRRSRERLLLAVLTVCPTPAKIATVPVEEFVHRVQQAFPGDHLLTKRLHAIHTEAQCSASVAAGASAVAKEVRHTVQQVRLFQGQITVWEDRLATVTATFPESRFLLSIPGVGPLTVAGLLGELGAPTGYARAKQLVEMAGTNPIESESAGKRSRHSPMSKKGRSSLRWCRWMASVSLLRHNPDFAAWTRALRERPAQAHPLKSGEVLGAVRNRLLRLAYALVKQQMVYRLPTPQQKAAKEVIRAHQAGRGIPCRDMGALRNRASRWGNRVPSPSWPTSHEATMGPSRRKESRISMLIWGPGHDGLGPALRRKASELNIPCGGPTATKVPRVPCRTSPFIIRSCNSLSESHLQNSYLEDISPPSTDRMVPVMNEAASEHSQITAAACSSGFPSRPIGILSPTPSRV